MTACGPGAHAIPLKTMNAPTHCKAGDLAIVISAYPPESIGQLVEVVGPTRGITVKTTSTGAIWHVRTFSGRRSLAYRCGNGSIGIVKRCAEGPMPDFRLRPFPGVRVVYEQGRAMLEVA